MDTPGMYSARPEIEIDGQRKPELEQGLIGLMVEESTAGLYRAELTLGNWGPTGNGEVDYLFFDRRVLEFGKSITIKAGEGATQATIFRGRIMALEGRFYEGRIPELAVLAEDRLQDLRMTRRTRTFEEVSDEDVIRQVASQHSLQTEIQLDSAPRHRVVAQVNQSDLAFLRERARAVGAELWVEGEKLFAKTRGRRGTEQISLTHGQKLLEFTVLADLAHQRTGLTVAGWDPAAKEAIAVEAAAAAVTSELDGHQSGSAILERALGARPDQIVGLSPGTDAEARALAEAAYRRIARRFLTGSGVAEGDGRIKVGVHVDLQGLGPLFAGKYYVSEVRHQFDAATGYRTHFRVERPWIGD